MEELDLKLAEEEEDDPNRIEQCLICNAEVPSLEFKRHVQEFHCEIAPPKAQVHKARKSIQVGKRKSTAEDFVVKLPKKEEWKCERCGEELQGEDQILSHVKEWCGEEKAVQCPLCKAGVMSGEAVGHLLSETHSEEFHGMEEEDGLRLLLGSSNGSGEHCSLCGRSLPSLSLLKAHSLVYHDLAENYRRNDIPHQKRAEVGVLKCGKCGACFRSKEALAGHVDIFHPQGHGGGSYLLEKALRMSQDDKGGWTAPSTKALEPFIRNALSVRLQRRTRILDPEHTYSSFS